MNNITTLISSLNVSGITTLQGNLDYGGGVAINGSNSFFTPSGIITGSLGIDAVNLPNTYIKMLELAVIGVI